MRRYGIFGLLAILLTLAVAAWAVDPWKGKPVDQWDENDVNKILSDSPWVRRIQIEAKWVKDGGSSAPAASPNGSQGPAGPPQATFIIRWNSARTARYALYRQALLHNDIKQDDYNKAMADVPDDYEVLIAGTDMTPFQAATESSLQSEGYLMDKKTKQKIPAKSVTIQKDPDGKVSVVVFSFFKKSLNGQDTIPEDQKNIDFDLNSPVKLHGTFDLTKMVDSKGRDL